MGGAREILPRAVGRSIGYLLISALLLLPMGTCTSPPPKELNLKAIRSYIDSLNEKWFEALERKDLDALLEQYTDDATIMPPNYPMLRGKNQIRAYYGRTPTNGKIININMNILELSGKDSTVFEIGNYTMDILRPDSTIIADTGKYNTIWKLQPDGSWKTHADCWNSSKPIRLLGAGNPKTPP